MFSQIYVLPVTKNNEINYDTIANTAEYNTAQAASKYILLSQESEGNKSIYDPIR